MSTGRCVDHIRQACSLRVASDMLNKAVRDDEIVVFHQQAGWWVARVSLYSRDRARAVEPSEVDSRHVCGLLWGRCPIARRSTKIKNPHIAYVGECFCEFPPPALPGAR
jgi:hypothetical protein